MPFFVEAIISLLLLAGGVFVFIGSLGMAHLRDFYMRLHGPTKATTLGIGCMLIASMGYFWSVDGKPDIQELLITLFLFITAPVSAHQAGAPPGQRARLGIASLCERWHLASAFFWSAAKPLTKQQKTWRSA